MRKLLKVPLLIPLLVMAVGCAAEQRAEFAQLLQAASEAELEEALAGFTPGPPQQCVRSRDLTGPQSIGDNTLLFRVSRNLMYRTETRGSCNRIGKGEALITRSYGNELCRGDIAQAADLSLGIQSDTCVLGEFVAYRRTR